MLFAYFERKMNDARLKREQAEKWVRWSADPSNKCTHCEGFGEVAVKGMRTSTGFSVCDYCGGMGVKPMRCE